MRHPHKRPPSRSRARAPKLTPFTERWLGWAEQRRIERGQFVDAPDHPEHRPAAPQPKFPLQLKVLCADGKWRVRTVAVRLRPNLWGSRAGVPKHAHSLKSVAAPVAAEPAEGGAK